MGDATENLKWLVEGAEEIDAKLKELGPALLPPTNRQLFAMVLLLSEQVRRLESANTIASLESRRVEHALSVPARIEWVDESGGKVGA